MAFPSFHGRERENASNFLDDLEMAFLVSGRDEDAVKLRAFPLVLREEAKSWFAGLPTKKKRSWEVLKDTFMAKFGAGDGGKSHPTFLAFIKVFVYILFKVCILRRALCSILGTVYYK